MSESPRISVLMAAYNAEAYIPQAIESVLTQTSQGWELIIVDDGSTDGTGEIAERYGAGDGRIRCYRNEGNLGIGPTRRRTLDLARGHYAAVLDADDAALPDWLSGRVAFLDAHEEVVVASGSRILVDERGRRLGVTREGAPPEVLQWQLLFGNPINNSSAVFRVTAALSVGGYRDYPYLEDWNLFARLSGSGRIVQSNEPHVMYRVHRLSASRTLGSDRVLLEPISRHIMAETVKRETGLTVPEELAWPLFRGRMPFTARERECSEALDFLLLALGEFLKRVPAQWHGAVAVAMLHDAAHVLRSGGWNLRQRWKALRSVVSRGGLRSLGSTTRGARAALKLLLPRRTAVRLPGARRWSADGDLARGA